MTFLFVLTIFLIPAVAQENPTNTGLTALKVEPSLVTLVSQKKSDTKTPKCTQFKATPSPGSADLKDLKWSLDPSDPSSGSIDEKKGCYTVPKREENKLPPAGRVTVKAMLGGVTGTATVVLLPEGGSRTISVQGKVCDTESRKAIQGTRVLIEDPDQKVIGYGTAAADGNFKVCATIFSAESGTNSTSGKSRLHILLAGAEGYREVVRKVDLSGLSGCAAAVGCDCADDQGPDHVYKVPDIFLETARNVAGEYSRAIVGFEQVAASSANSERKFFLDFFISTPFPFLRSAQGKDTQPKAKNIPSTGQDSKREVEDTIPLRLWGDVRASSVPQPTSASLGEFTTNFLSNFAAVPVNQLVSSLEFLAGLEIRLPGKTKSLWGAGNSGKQRFSWSLILSGGAITPQSTEQSVQFFEIPTSQAEAVKQQFGVTTKYIGFVPEGRNRFFRQFYAGFRFKTIYLDRFENEINRFPAMLDVTYGANELATRGHVRGGVFRIEGFFPLPWDSVRYLYLFGTAVLKPSTSHPISPDLFNTVVNLTPATSTAAKPVTIVQLPQMDRDYYRVGVGIDAIALFSYLKDLKSQGQSK
ncbi:MAG TPA: hypothetical protein VE398_24350 [Acidobacteriota bacterium]|nr:hypothetical protein [Acidobacteriota bacterium]